MKNKKKLIVSHAPFWHDGNSIAIRNKHIMLAALPAILFGIVQYGAGTIAVLSFSMATAIFWELGFNYISKRPASIADGNAAVIGMLLGMLAPATTPWWVILVGTFLCIVIGKHIFGGIGGNPFHPTALGVAILMVAWPKYFDFDQALTAYQFDFYSLYPLGAVKHFGVSQLGNYSLWGLFFGNQIGGTCTAFGAGLLIGGIYLMLRGFIRWEISISYLAGLFIAAMLFNIAAPDKFAGPFFHLLTGYSLIGAFFLVTEESSSPVNFIPMIIYGAGAGFMIILIRNIGNYLDGVILATLLMNLVNPLIDKIRPKAMGKVLKNA